MTSKQRQNHEYKHKPILTCQLGISRVFPECIFLRICTSEDYIPRNCNLKTFFYVISNLDVILKS